MDNGARDDWPSKSYLRQVGRVGLLTREGELELARRRDRGWAVGRWLALAGVDAGAWLDAKIADHRDPRARERLEEWRKVQRRCRKAVAAREWVRARKAMDALRPAVDALALDQRGWLPLVTNWVEMLAQGLLTDEHDDDRLTPIEQHLGYPRSRWVELSSAIVEGERAAKRAIDDLVEANLRLVLHVVGRYRTQEMMSIADLVQEGNLGLIQAAERFDPGRGLRFATLALWWIRQGMTRSISNHGRTVRIPVNSIEKLAKIKRVRGEFNARENREPTAEELAERLGMSVPRVEHLLTVDFEPISIDARVDDETSLSDVLPDTRAVDLVEHVNSLERSSYARAMLRGQLSDSERQVLRLRFGFEPAGELTPDAVARELSTNKEQVRAIEAEAIEKLRRHWGG